MAGHPGARIVFLSTKRSRRMEQDGGDRERLSDGACLQAHWRAPAGGGGMSFREKQQ